MKIHTKLSYIIFIMGIFLYTSGYGRLSGLLDYNLLIPNKFVAITFIIIGVFVMFISFFIKSRKHGNEK